MPLKDACAATTEYNRQSAVLTSLEQTKSEYKRFLKHLEQKCQNDTQFPSTSTNESIQALILAQIANQETAMQNIQVILDDLEVQIQQVQTCLDELRPKCLQDFIEGYIFEGNFDPQTTALWKSGGLYYVCRIEDFQHILTFGDVVFLRKSHRHGCIPILEPRTRKYFSKDLKHVSFAIFINMGDGVVGEITSETIFKWFGWKGIIPFLTFLHDKVVLVGNQLETNPGGGKPFCAQSEKLMFRFVNGTGLLFDPETLPWFEFQGVLHCTECPVMYSIHPFMFAHTAKHNEDREKAKLADTAAQFLIDMTTKKCPICLTPCAKETRPDEACNHMQCTICRTAGRPWHWCFYCGLPRNDIGHQVNVRGEILKKCTQECQQVHNFCKQYSLTVLPDGSHGYVITGCSH